MTDVETPPRLPPYLAFFGTVLLLGPVHLVTPGPQLLRFPATLVGLVAIAAGVVFAVGQQRAIERHGQGGMYTDVPSRLIDDGVFRYSRNPLYLAMILLTLGIAVLLGSLAAVVLVVLEFVAMNVWGIPYEERVLAREFGDDYAAYRRHVRRWL